MKECRICGNVGIYKVKNNWFCKNCLDECEDAIFKRQIQIIEEIKELQKENAELSRLKEKIILLNP